MVIFVHRMKRDLCIMELLGSSHYTVTFAVPCGQLALIYLVKLVVYYTNLLLSITRCIRGWSWLFGIYMELSWASSTQRNLFLSTYQNMKWTGPNWTEIHFVWSYYYYYYSWYLVVSRLKEIIFTSLNWYVVFVQIILNSVKHGISNYNMSV